MIGSDGGKKKVNLNLGEEKVGGEWKKVKAKTKGKGKGRRGLASYSYFSKGNNQNVNSNFQNQKQGRYNVIPYHNI